MRRRAWPTTSLADEAVGRARFEAGRLDEIVTFARSYVVEESDGTIGSVCIYEAVSPEAIRGHAAAAELPIDEIVKVVDTVVVADHDVPAPSQSRREES